MLGAIWAQSIDGVIGDGTDMPWHLPEDLAHFKDVTTGHSIIMGRRTWESIPERFRPLPGRDNIVMSSREPGAWSQGASVTSRPTLSDGWIMGGGQLYSATIDQADVLEVTVIDVHLRDVLGEKAVLAPSISDDFQVVSDTDWLTSERGSVRGNTEPVRYRFIRYERQH